MAPTATTPTSSGTPTAIPIITTPTPSDGFNGEDFINNLGSDLAPLLTLFGEQVTKQFLSMSLGWADHILLAVGPLGIITTVVSAIRVSNVRVLKAIIGRAREKIATAELELLSSTSDATSELWTEEGVVRQAGHAKILEMVVYKCKPISNQAEIGLEDPSQNYIGDLSDVYKRGVLISDAQGDSETDNEMLAKRLTYQPPNLTLNVHGALPGSGELWAFAMVGVPADYGAFELLTGFMDALWRGMNLKYHEERRHWYAERNMSDKVIDTDKVVRHLIGSGLVSSEIDAKVLVFSSLARCTVWKNPPDPDEPTITTDQDLDSSSPSIPGTQDERLQREESKRNTSGKAEADESPRDNAETPGEPEHRPISAPGIPTTSISEAVQAAESSRTDSIAPEGSVHQPNSTQNGPVPSLSAVVQEGHSSRAGAITLDAPEDEPTLTATTPSPRTSETMSSQHDKGKHTGNASVLHD
ncbi:uncharacterized protein J4E88_003815 [Alternaria novae-zelandiae]|uniref:uncharacterized protein n=1 Tax=Alternaria novae-zelandiae TaxID=430562 RepID=UPI0020C3D7E1|nr:uncharacterized protein J4E88_003815 [Alternaria novae-zelandiae]KAI4685978.1 hypothetical protein J4E88_003815 [Alternaria novae-zelandiae]